MPSCEGSASHSILVEGRELMEMLDEQGNDEMNKFVFSQLRSTSNSSDMLAGMIVQLANDLRSFKLHVSSQKDSQEVSL